jgi:hypothetical protein
MIVNIPRTESDDNDFLTALNGLLARVVDEHLPKEVYLIRLDNWFDHKWLGFSGIGTVPFESVNPWIDAALDEFRQDHLTFPPFNPHRIVCELAYHRTGHSQYRPNHRARKIHKHQNSAANLQKRVYQFSDSALFLWFSSKSMENGRASLMSYLIDGRRATAWFASFIRTKRWRLDRTRGIDRNRLEEWFPLGRTNAGNAS